MPRNFGDVQLEQLLVQTRLAVAATDASGTMTLYSPALQEMLGLSAGELDESEMVEHFDLYRPDGRTRLLTEEVPLVRAGAGEVVLDEVICCRRTDGTLLHLRCNAAPLRLDHEQIGAVVLVQDVTAEYAAHRAQAELRERLVVTINHELRTPMTKLAGHAELLADHRDELPAHLQASVEVVQRAADDLVRLAEKVSALADLEAHAHTGSRSTAWLSRVVEQCIGSVKSEAEARGIAVVRDVPPRLRAIVDRAEVTRAVEALLDNAVRFAPDGSEVGIRVLRDEDWVRIEVWDQGAGISEEDRARVLEPFERGDSDDVAASSQGLGLPLARTIARAHGGNLELSSNQPRGLLATMLLPRD